MEKDICEKIALKRFEIISPVLAEPGRVQNQYFRKQAQREHEFPRYGGRKVKVSTMKAWLRNYRKHGFEGLKPKGRSDGGRPRRMSDEVHTDLVSQAVHPGLKMLDGMVKIQGRSCRYDRLSAGTENDERSCLQGETLHGNVSLECT